MMAPYMNSPLALLISCFCWSSGIYDDQRQFVVHHTILLADHVFRLFLLLLFVDRKRSRGNLLTGTLLGKLKEKKECKSASGINVGFQFVAFECLMRKADQILYYWGILQVFLLCGLVFSIMEKTSFENNDGGTQGLMVSRKRTKHNHKRSVTLFFGGNIAI